VPLESPATPASRKRAVALAALALACATGAAAAATVDYRFGGVQYRGDFGSDRDVRLEQYPFEISFNRPASRLTLTLAYERIGRTGNVTLAADGPVVLGAGGPGRPPFQTSTAGESASGRGDLLIRDELFISRAGKGKRPALAWVVDLKLPTADEKQGLGTGKRDWGFGLSYMQPLSACFQIMGQALYRFMGDPEGIDFRNGLRASAGIALVARRTTWRALVENVPPVLDRVPFYDAAGVPIGIQEVTERRYARLDLTVRSQTGGTTRLGVTRGITQGAEDVGFLLEFSTGGR